MREFCPLKPRISYPLLAPPSPLPSNRHQSLLARRRVAVLAVGLGLRRVVLVGSRLGFGREAAGAHVFAGGRLGRMFG